ncbi:MAG: ribonuclease III [Bacillota bacterium]|nr:ribonuclease III [Bacillota bacterium]
MLDLDTLQASIGIFWNNRELLGEALTHSSYSFEHPEAPHNQRLEFLGDAVLEIIISEHLFRLLPRSSEGELTKLRAAVVCEPALARVARRLGLGEALRMGRGEELSGGRERASVLADAFEAFLGAMYLDRGLEVTRQFVLRYLGPLVGDAVAGKAENDYKTQLQEYLQRQSPDPIRYVIVREEGPDHNKVFTAGVLYRGRILGEGSGRTKKEAEQYAARQALQQLLHH